MLVEVEVVVTDVVTPDAVEEVVADVVCGLVKSSGLFFGS